MTYKATPEAASDFMKKHGKPTVLSHQPDTFRLLTDKSDLKIWEAKLKAELGISIDLDHLTESCTDSGNDCDTD